MLRSAQRVSKHAGGFLRILGFMSGTSLDAVDMAILETDGEILQAFGPSGERKLSTETRAVVLRATEAAKTWARGTPEPNVFAEAARAVAEEHLAAAREFLAANGLSAADLDLVGFHGQTVLHERPTKDRIGRTVQLGDGALLAKGLGVPVAFDFRSADVAAGGEGAPLAPIYHAARARASGLAPPVAILNLGGVANITLIPSSGDLIAFDTGPANGMIDLWVQAKTDHRFDPDGQYARAGRVDEAALAVLLDHSYFATPGPKSLDRYDFALTPVEHLSLEDGAATLTAFTAETVAIAVKSAAEPPTMLIASGGGRLNPTLMAVITARAGVPVTTAEALGWRGDAIEAEAFAYLAARTFKGLPISFPGTTGAPRPMTGGVIVQP
jgi:anhydro-N-acetylmuramic acid kinase